MTRSISGFKFKPKAGRSSSLWLCKFCKAGSVAEVTLAERVVAEGTEGQEYERLLKRSLTIKTGEQSYRLESRKILRHRQSKYLSVRHSDWVQTKEQCTKPGVARKLYKRKSEQDLEKVSFLAEKREASCFSLQIPQCQKNVRNPSILENKLRMKGVGRNFQLNKYNFGCQKWLAAFPGLSGALSSFRN